jgi:antibiotic biosynthesis monooxygenase (ABM) superfamily enzyme
MKQIKSQYIEGVRFNLKAGVTTEQFLKAENDIRNGAIQKQVGYQGRDMYQDDADGSWLIIIRWDNKEAAEAWTPIFITLKEGQAFGSLLDFSSARQEHYTLVNP